MYIVTVSFTGGGKPWENYWAAASHWLIGKKRGGDTRIPMLHIAILTQTWQTFFIAEYATKNSDFNHISDWQN